MKLISCYVENFGCLHRYSRVFAPGLTVIEAPNGAGKTTLAEFLRAMFYGFPRSSASLEKNPRKKYAPWQGGPYGGNLVFYHEGKQYRIERTFGDTPKGDTFRLTDNETHLFSDRFTEHIGQEIFGIDADAFLRSTYLSQLSDAVPMNTGSIRAKLGNLIEDTDDIMNYDAAVKRLQDQRRELLRKDKKGGAIFEAQRRISQLQLQLQTDRPLAGKWQETRQALEENETMQQSTQEQLIATRDAVTEALRLESAAGIYSQYELMQTQYREQMAQVRSISQNYPKGFPEDEVITKAATLLNRAAGLQEDIPPNASEEEAMQFIASNGARFDRPLPTAKEISQKKERCTAYMTLQSALRHSAMSDEEAQTLRELEDFFAGGVPAEEKLNQARDRLEEAAVIRQQIVELTSQPAPEPKPVPKVPSLIPAILLALLAGLAMGGGAYLLLQKIYPYGAAAAVAGVVLLLGAILLAIRRHVAGTPPTQTEAPSYAEQIREYELQARGLEQSVQQLMSHYALEHSLSLYEQIAQLKAKAAQYRTLQHRSRHAGEEQDLLRRQLDAIVGEVSGFLRPYCGNVPPERFFEALNRLQTDCEQYTRARNLVSQHEALNQARHDERKRCLSTLTTFSEHFRLPHPLTDHGALSALQADRSRYQLLLGQAKQYKSDMDLFRMRHSQILAQERNPDAPDAAALQEQEKQLSQQLQTLATQAVTLRQQERQLRTKVDALPDLEDELRRLYAQRAEDEKRCELLDKTVQYLEQAKQSLSGNYSAPIRKSFAAYMERLMGESPEHLLITPDLEVQLERYGQARPLAQLSQGQSDMVYLCMRLALSDALFKGEHCFMILDDPFVNLDDEHTAKAAQMLRELSRDHQIIYLVCNSSRAL